MPKAHMVSMAAKLLILVSRAGLEPIGVIEAKQVIDFINRQKRSNRSFRVSVS
jgi:hypothetical protein